MIEFLELGGATMRMKPIGTLLGAILLFSACNNKEQNEYKELATHADVEPEIMALGDTAEITAAFGHYAITIDAVRISDNFDGMEP